MFHTTRNHVSYITKTCFIRHGFMFHTTRFHRLFVQTSVIRHENVCHATRFFESSVQTKVIRHEMPRLDIKKQLKPCRMTHALQKHRVSYDTTMFHTTRNKEKACFIRHDFMFHTTRFDTKKRVSYDTV